MRLIKTICFSAILLQVLSACTSTEAVVQKSPQRPPVSAWLMEPEPDILPLLDNIVRPVSIELPKKITEPSASVSSAAAQK